MTWIFWTFSQILVRRNSKELFNVYVRKCFTFWLVIRHIYWNIVFLCEGWSIFSEQTGCRCTVGWKPEVQILLILPRHSICIVEFTYYRMKPSPPTVYTIHMTEAVIKIKQRKIILKGQCHEKCLSYHILSFYRMRCCFRPKLSTGPLIAFAFLRTSVKERRLF